jgi:hypothetical protein
LAGIQGPVPPPGQDLGKGEHRVIGSKIPDLLLERRLADIHAGLDERGGQLVIREYAVIHQDQNTPTRGERVQPEAVVARGEGDAQSELDRGAWSGVIFLSQENQGNHMNELAAGSGQLAAGKRLKNSITLQTQ